MKTPEGLVYCVKDWSDTFCVCKSIEFLVSLALFLFLLHDFIIRFLKERQFNFFFLVCFEMLTALLANLVFTLDHNVRPLQYIEGYAYDVYFTTIVYQVTKRLLRLKETSKYIKWIRLAVHMLLVFFLVFLTVTFVLRNIFTYYSCEEAWFLVINLFGISLSILMVVAGKFYSKAQEEKIQGMIEKNTKNPLPEVWKWIAINIICQLVRFIRSFIYIVSPYNCQFTKNYAANQVLALMFQLFSFHVGMLATIFFFRRRPVYENYSVNQFTGSIRERIETNQSKVIEMEPTTRSPLKQENNDLNIEKQRISAKMFLHSGKSSQRRVSVSEKKDVFFSI